MQIALLFLGFFFRALPRRMALAIGVFLGWVWYYLVPIRRGEARRNLAQALPQLSQRARRRILRRTFVHQAMNGVELLLLPGLTLARSHQLLAWTGREHLQEALAGGRGVIVACAHFGNFDFLAAAAALEGIPLSVVSRVQRQQGINRYWMKARRRFGIEILPVRSAIFRMGRVLRQGGVLALMIDQHMPAKDGLVVPFFGRPASTTQAPAFLSLATGAPILAAVVEREGLVRHRVRIEAPVFSDPKQPHEDELRRVTLSLNQWLEGQVQRRPDHWLWLHRRWKAENW